MTTTFQPMPWAKDIPLIGLGYRAGSGKDTVADYLVREHGFVKFAFAGALKKATKELCGFTEAQMNGTLEEKEAVDARWGFSPRWFMQRFGTEVGRAIDQDFWVKVMDGRLRSDVSQGALAWVWRELMPVRGVVISDMRFPNEMAAIQAWGGYAVEVFRPGVSTTTGSHASETALEGVTFNARVENTGTLENLYGRSWDMMAQCKRPK